MATQSTGGTWQPGREELLKALEKRIYDFEVFLSRSRGFEFSFQTQRKIAFLWSLAELEKEGINGTIKELAEITGTPEECAARALRELFKAGVLDKSTGKYGRYIYSLNEEYLKEIHSLQNETKRTY